MSLPSSHAAKMVPLLTFTLGEQYYAVLVDDVVEVAAMVELINVPETPPEILGVANRHGEVLLVIDLRVVMGCPAPAIDEWTLFIVGQHEDKIIGLVVDEVQQVEYIPSAQIHKSSTAGKHIRGIISYRQRLIQLLDLSQLVTTYSSGAITDDLVRVDL